MATVKTDCTVTLTLSQKESDALEALLGKIDEEYVEALNLPVDYDDIYKDIWDLLPEPEND